MLRSGTVRGYDFNRMVMTFMMMNGLVEVPCAISTEAMDFQGQHRLSEKTSF